MGNPGGRRKGKGKAQKSSRFLAEMHAYDLLAARKDRWEYRRRQLGTFGPASEVRKIDPKTWKPS